MFKRLLIMILMCSLTGTLVSQTRQQEYDLKAAFLYHFTRYIDWENNRPAKEFVIGIIGSSPISMALGTIAKNNTVNNKRIVIRSISRMDDIVDCQIVFISKNNPYSLQSILEKAPKGVLTVGEESGTAKMGAAFNFIIKDEKVKFEANLKAINSAGLKASSQLLKLAQIVG